MKRAVILGGAGAMGRIIARDMKQAGVIEPVIADRDLGPAEGLDIELVPVDVFDADSLARALAGAACVIASLPYRMNLLAMDAALLARAHYIDLGGLYHVTLRQRGRHDVFRDAGLMAIVGMGSAPGILNVMAAHAAEGMTRVDEVHCMVGAHDGTRWATPPLLPFGYSPDTLLDEFALPSALFRDGAIRMVPPLAAAERRRERFPDPVGELVLDTTLHSEVATLPDFFRERGVREVTFRQGFEATFADRLRLLVELGLADTTPLAAINVVPRDLLKALLGRLTPPRPLGPVDRHEILRVRVLGSAGGPHEVVVDCYAGPAAGGGLGPDIDTGAPPSIAAQLLDGELAVRPGVYAPEQVIPWAPFRRELERRGMTISSGHNSNSELISGG
jgi:saccharopine dehydrogenase-like NADP-dependent oxidoreductase